MKKKLLVVFSYFNCLAETSQSTHYILHKTSYNLHTIIFFLVILFTGRRLISFFLLLYKCSLVFGAHWLTTDTFSDVCSVRRDVIDASGPIFAFFSHGIGQMLRNAILMLCIRYA